MMSSRTIGCFLQKATYEDTGRDTVEDTDGEQGSSTVGGESIVNTNSDGNSNGSDEHERDSHKPRLPSLSEG
jgi:hypothetical protein